MSEQYKFNDPEGLYFITSTVVDWVDVFTRPEYKLIIIDSLKYNQEHKGLIIHAWCLMTNHFHMIVSSRPGISLSDIMRDFKKFTSKALVKEISEISESRKNWMLKRFEYVGKYSNRIKYFKFWQDGLHAMELTSNNLIDQKLDYIHNNPVTAEIVCNPEDYLYSSARDYIGEKGLLDIELLD